MSGIVLGPRPWFASVAVAVALMGLAAPGFAQSDEQRAGARTLATAGAAAFNEGRFKDAVDLFSKAESLVHAPPHLLFMARAHAKLGHFVKAREAYWKILKEQLPPNAPQAFRDAQAAADEERKQVEPHIGRLLIKVEGADAAKDLSVSVDGQPFATVLLGVPQPMDPGEHTVTATATGFKAAPATVSLKAAGLGAVTVKLEADASAPAPGAPPAAPAAEAEPTTPAPSGAPPSDTGPAKGGSNGLRIGSYVGFGVGAVGLALGTVFVLKSSSKRSDADAAASNAEKTWNCKPNTGCDIPKTELDAITELDDQAGSAKTIGVIGFVVGGLGVATGVTLFVLSNKKEEGKVAGGAGAAAATGWVAPYVGLNQLGVRGAF